MRQSVLFAPIRPYEIITRATDLTDAAFQPIRPCSILYFIVEFLAGNSHYMQGKLDANLKFIFIYTYVFTFWILLKVAFVFKYLCLVERISAALVNNFEILL